MKRHSAIDRKLIKHIKKDAFGILRNGKIIYKKYDEDKRISPSEYIFLSLGCDIAHTALDVVNLIEAGKYYPPSIIKLTRSIVESYLYIKYILCVEKESREKLDAYMVYSYEKSDQKTLKMIIDLERKGKFIFDRDKKSIISKFGIGSKITALDGEIKSIKDRNAHNKSFQREIEIFSRIEQVAIKYDNVMGIGEVIEGSENLSMEWIYVYVYRFQSLLSHQSIRAKEQAIDHLVRPDSTRKDTASLAITSDILQNLVKLNNSLKSTPTTPPTP